MRKQAAIYDPYLDTLGGGERYCLTIAEILLKKGTYLGSSHGPCVVGIGLSVHETLFKGRTRKEASSQGKGYRNHEEGL